MAIQFLLKTPIVQIGTSKCVLLIPSYDFEIWLEGMWITKKDETLYWHVVIDRKGDKYDLHRKKGEKKIDLTSYIIPTNI